MTEHVAPEAASLSRPVTTLDCAVLGDLFAESAGGSRVTDPVTIDSGINDGGAAVYLRDPDGYTIELFQPPA
jgi:catechol 2,3-dioxygenase-like lactoylglutathione lyase family enzyme